VNRPRAVIERAAIHLDVISAPMWDNGVDRARLPYASNEALHLSAVEEITLACNALLGAYLGTLRSRPSSVIPHWCRGGVQVQGTSRSVLKVQILIGCC
jgi:hypothetical protein